MTQELRPISRLSSACVLAALVYVAGCSQPQHPTAPSAGSPPAGQAQVVLDGSPFFGAMSSQSFGSQVDWSTFAIAAGGQPLVIAADQPNPPGTLAFTVTGSTVVLTWSPPAPGARVDAYMVEAGTGPGLGNIARFNTGSTATTLTVTGVPAFTYYVRVRAVNQDGESGASNESTIVVGNVPPPPPGVFGLSPAGPIDFGTRGLGCTSSSSSRTFTVTTHRPTQSWRVTTTGFGHPLVSRQLDRDRGTGGGTFTLTLGFAAQTSFPPFTCADGFYSSQGGTIYLNADDHDGFDYVHVNYRLWITWQ